MKTMIPLSKEEEGKLLSAYRTLEQFSEHDLPVLRFNCRKAKNELWQALFELDLIGTFATGSAPMHTAPSQKGEQR